MSLFNPQDFAILIVDNDQPIVEFLVNLLKNHQYKVHFVATGEDALETLKKIKIDIILLDLLMSQMGDFEVIQSLKCNPNTVDIPIIFIDGNSNKNNIIKAFELGAVDYLIKPFNIPELLARVKNHLTLNKKQLQLQQSKEELNTIVTHLFDGIIIVNKEGNVLFVNPAAAQMLNKKVSELINYSLGIPILLQKSVEIEIIAPDNTIGIAELTTNKTQWQGQDVYLISLRDITQRKNLERLASTDTLTKLDNRRRFFDVIKQEFNRSLRYQTTFSVISIDVDNFKLINDSYGHPVGDKALLSVVKEISDHLRNVDYFARLGGDEFMILLPETTKKQAIKVAKRISNTFCQFSLTHEQNTIPITLSIGIDSYQKGDQIYDDVLKRVDHALYQAKEKGKNQIYPNH